MYIVTVCIALVMLACLPVSSAATDPDPLPESKVFKYKDKSALVFLPRNYTTQKRYPLVVFLYGRGGSLQDNNYISPEFAALRSKLWAGGYIVVVPDYGSDCWLNASAEQTVLECLKHSMVAFSVNRDRVYMMGVSMGGGSSLVFTAKHRSLIAGVCDIMGITDYTRFSKESNYTSDIAAAYGGTSADLPDFYRDRSALHHRKELSKLPVLVIHGETDPVVPISYSEDLSKSLKPANPAFTFIRVPNIDHSNAVINGLEDKIVEFFKNKKTNFLKK